MGKIFNTREVSGRLGISSKTIRLWVKKYNIPYGSNDLGHYLYNENAMEMLADVKKEFIKSESNLLKVQPTQTQNKLENKLEQILDRLDSVELELSRKANDIVSVQVLQHRSEIEEILVKLEEIEGKMGKAETHTDKLKHLSDYKIKEEDIIYYEKPLKKRIMSLFSF